MVKVLNLAKSNLLLLVLLFLSALNVRNKLMLYYLLGYSFFLSELYYFKNQAGYFMLFFHTTFLLVLFSLIWPWSLPAMILFCFEYYLYRKDPANKGREPDSKFSNYVLFIKKLSIKVFAVLIAAMFFKAVVSIAFFKRGQMEFQNGKYEKAEKYLRRSSKYFNNSYTELMIAELYYKIKKPEVILALFSDKNVLNKHRILPYYYWAVLASGIADNTIMEGVVAKSISQIVAEGRKKTNGDLIDSIIKLYFDKGVVNSLYRLAVRQKIMPVDCISDDGFETLESSILWQECFSIYAEKEVRFSIDREIKNKGKSSLRIQFDFTEDPNIYQLILRLPIIPFKKYRFSAYFKTQDLTTPLRFEAVTSRKTGEYTVTAFFPGTSKWQVAVMDFEIKDNTDEVIIQLRHHQLYKKPLKGTLWIDDWKLERI